MQPLTLESMREAIARLLDESHETVGDHDDLIGRGLDSIRIMSLVGLCRRCGAKVSFAELAERPTVASWWELVAGRLPPITPADVTAVEPSPHASVDPVAPFALTPMQHAYWVGRGDDQVLGGVGCHAYLEFECVNVDPGRLERAVRALTKRHGMLRARFLMDGRQQIMPTSAWPGLTVHDLRSASIERAAARFEAVRETMSHRRLDVERGEVFDVQLSLLPSEAQNQGASIIHLSVDLLVADVLSIQLLLADLARSYSDPSRELSPLAYEFPQYLADYDRERAEIREKAKAYWRGRLEDMPGGPQLPLAKAPEEVARPRFTRRIHRLTPAEWQRFAERARQHGITPAMAVLAAYAEVLGAWSAQPRFLISIPLFDRQPLRPEVAGTVADFTNLVLTTTDVSQPRSFRDRALQIQAQFQTDAAHADYSGVDVLRDLARSDPTEPRIAPVVFACNIGSDFVGEEFRRELGDLRWMISQTPQVWLDHQVYEMRDHLVLCWDAVEELFPAGVLDDMFDAYRGLVDELAASDADWSASPRPFLPERQRHVRLRVNSTLAPQRSRLLHEGFFDWAAWDPERVALAWDGGAMSYGELSGRALQVAALLRERGVSTGDLIAVALPKGADQIAVVLGVLAAGGIYVPVSPEQPAARRRRIVERTGIRWAFRAQADDSEWPDGVELMAVEQASERDPSPAPVPLDADAVAYVIFTSGSTGEPKGVEIAHRAAVNTIEDINERYAVGKDDRVLAVSALDFDLSVYDVFGLLGAGGSLVLIREDQRRDAFAWAELAHRHQVTVWNTVPTLLDMLLLAAEKRGLPASLRLALVSGEWVGLDLFARLARSTEGRCALVALGGATEASIWSNALPVNGVPEHWASIPYGFPLRNQCYRVVDAQGRDCPDWVPGELWIGGVGVANGYRGDPAQTQERFVLRAQTACAELGHGPRWYRTGDLGRYWPDGTLEFLGRRDQQVKIRGHRIELGEIEAALGSHPAVRSAVAAAVPSEDHRGYRALAAFVVPVPSRVEPAAADVGDREIPGVTLIDPLDRAEFKLSELGIRREEARPRISLGIPSRDRRAEHAFRRSDREFLSRPVSLELFGELLACLCRWDSDGLPKYRYPSAGGLHPVQTYVHVKPDRIEGVPGGFYYHDPRDSSLVILDEGAVMDREVHGAHNHDLADAAAFSLIFVADLAAIEPMYGQLSRDLCLLEAGYMGQLLMDWAATRDIGLCPIGGLDFARIRSSLAASDSHLFVHAMLGGPVERASQQLRETTAARTTTSLTDELHQWLHGRVPEYMVPGHIVLLQELPRTTSGKVDRRSLPALLQQTAESAAQVAPATATERALAAMWCELLELRDVGVNQDFLDLGGHSLTATRLIARVRNALHVDLTLRNVFQARTVAKLAGLVDRLKVEQSEFLAIADSLPAVQVDPARRFEPFPLTDMQQAYCLGRVDSFELGNVSTHVYMELEGESLDLVRFERAWQRLIDRHEMLRAVMSADTNEQRILADVPPFRLQILDLRQLPPDAIQAQLDAIRERLSHEVRPADQFPLFEVLVTRLDEQRSRVHWSVDALISDFASWQVLFRDLSDFYDEPDVELPALELSFRDYVLAERRIDGSQLHEQSKAYWLERLPELPSAPELPMIKDPSEVEFPHFVRRQGRLSAAAWGKLKLRAAQAGLTPSGLVLAAYAEVVGTWSRSAHFVLNVPRLNRLPLHPQVNELVGEFASFTLLEVDNRHPEAFEARARRMQERLWNDLQHQYVSGVWILRELMRTKGGFSRALMPVVLTSTLALPRGQGKPLERSLRLVYGVSQTPQVWIDHQVEERDAELRFNWDAVEELFPPGLVDDMFAAYTQLLERLAADDSAWSASDLELAPRAQLARRAESSATTVLPDVLVQSLFERQVEARPTHPAVIAGERMLTYGELYARSNQVAHWLRKGGARPNTMVAIVMEKGWEQVVACFATLFSGAAYLPIDAHLPEERIRHLLDRGEVELVLTQSHVRNKLPAGQPRSVLSLDQPFPAGLSPLPLPPVQGPDDLAYTLFTSGSTGQPKGAMIAHRGLVNCLTETLARFGITAADRCLAVTALHHDMSVFDILAVLGAGGTVVVPDAAEMRNASHWGDLIARHGVTIWNSVPATMEMLLEDNRDHSLLSSLRLAFLGGDWIPLEMPRELRRRVPDMAVVSVGGPTETTLWNIWYPIDAIDPSWRSIPYGKPIANTRYHILNESMQHCPDWVTGQMYCSGAGLALGYWRDPERTAAAFRLDPRTGERLYQTGDLGRWRADGNIEFVGRADFQVKIRGHRIELGEIEAALATHDAVKAAVVIPVAYEDRPGYRSLRAYVVRQAGNGVSETDLARHLRNQLPEHMIPARFALLERLPLTANNKVDRRALLSLDVASDGQETDFAPPRTALEQTLAGVWAEVLGCLDPIGVNDDFFRLGGDSLLATRIVARLKDIFEGEAISLKVLFASSTISSMAQALTSLESTPGRLERIATHHVEIDKLSLQEIDAALSQASAGPQLDRAAGGRST